MGTKLVLGGFACHWLWLHLLLVSLPSSLPVPMGSSHPCMLGCWGQGSVFCSSLLTTLISHVFIPNEVLGFEILDAWIGLIHLRNVQWDMFSLHLGWAKSWPDFISLKSARSVHLAVWFVLIDYNMSCASEINIRKVVALHQACVTCNP